MKQSVFPYHRVCLCVCCSVETALPQVVPSVTAEAARQLFHESRQKGAAMVIVAVKVLPHACPHASVLNFS